MEKKEDNQPEEKGNKTAEIDEIREELKLLKEKLLPDRLAKAVDASYARIRLFLQILAIMITIFLTGAVGFGFFGVKNIFSIYREAAEVQSLAEKVSEDQKEVEKSLNLAKGMESQIEQTINDFNDTFERTISDMRSQSQKEISGLKTEVAAIRGNLDKISNMFNRVAVKEADTLNAREVQLLVLLAHEIDPNKSTFILNAAVCALKFQRYDEAINHCDRLLKSPDNSPKEIVRAKEIKRKAEKQRDMPPKVTPAEEAKKGTFIKIGPYSPMGLHENTLKTLVRKGYLSVQEAQKILEDSK